MPYYRDFLISASSSSYSSNAGTSGCSFLIDSVCQPVRNHRAHVFNELADIGYNSSKHHLWFYGFKVHMLVTLSGYILNYVVTPASVHYIRAVDDLLENCSQPYVLADLAYLSYELREQLKQKGYHFQNFVLF